MDYTHYWDNKKAFTAQQWERLCQASADIFDTAKKTGINLQFDDDIYQPPLIDATCIRFNGRGNTGHETFLLTRKTSKDNFCNTKYKPYDDAVVAVLIAAENIHGEGEGFSWHSDGTEETGLTYCARRLLRGVL